MFGLGDRPWGEDGPGGLGITVRLNIDAPATRRIVETGLVRDVFQPVEHAIRNGLSAGFWQTQSDHGRRRYPGHRGNVAQVNRHRLSPRREWSAVRKDEIDAVLKHVGRDEDGAKWSGKDGTIVPRADDDAGRWRYPVAELADIVEFAGHEAPMRRNAVCHD